jgi:hypothetical protein
MPEAPRSACRSPACVATNVRADHRARVMEYDAHTLALTDSSLYNYARLLCTAAVRPSSARSARPLLSVSSSLPRDEFLLRLIGRRTQDHLQQGRRCRCIARGAHESIEVRAARAHTIPRRSPTRRAHRRATHRGQECSARREWRHQDVSIALNSSSYCPLAWMTCRLRAALDRLAAHGRVSAPGTRTHLINGCAG